MRAGLLPGAPPALSSCTAILDRVAISVHPIHRKAGGLRIPAENPSHVPHREDLEAAAAAWRAAIEVAERRRAELTEAIVRADRDGVPVASVARFAGLDRKSVLKHLRQAGRR
jgi:hypothetical protein